MIIAFQFIMICSIIVYVFVLMIPPFKINSGDNFFIVQARFIASVMMNLNLIPDIQSGLSLAKYCVSHPFRFRNSKYIDGEGKERIRLFSILPPFLIAISQVIMGMMIGIISLLYLNNLSNLMQTVTSFVTFFGITKFDNMYADMLQQNKLRDSNWKKLKKYFKNSHIDLG